MVCTVWSAVLQGVSATLVRIEASASPGLPQVRIVGMPAVDVKESLDRVRQALRTLGVTLPARRIVINLFPASVRKSGSQLDLPIAVALLRIAHASLGRWLDSRTVFCLGELGLDGSVHSVDGMLPLVMANASLQSCVSLIPTQATSQLYYQPSEPLHTLTHLRELLQECSVPLWSGWDVSSQEDACLACSRETVSLDLVRGQTLAKRALQIAVAGGHHLLLTGPPGCGKSFLAKQSIELMPRIPLSTAESLLRIQSICGDPMRVCDVCGSVRPPLRAPHHTITSSVLIGGGAKVRPGEVSRAHQGVLLLDEIGEMKRSVVESLRQPLQDGVVSIARHLDRVTLPARFQLIATMNPCPCGHFGSSSATCECSHVSRERYRSLVYGPIGDRFDLIVRMEAVKASEYVSSDSVLGEDRVDARSGSDPLSSLSVTFDTSFGTCLQRAVSVQRERRIKNAWLTERHRSSFLRISEADTQWWALAVERMGLTARNMLSVLRLARTIADLQGVEDIERAQLAEALQLRRL